MEFDTFSRLFRTSLPVGLVLDNPGRGTSTIMWCDDEQVCFLRGKSRLYVGLRDLHAAYLHFAGRSVDARQLKDYQPHLFDSERKGHNCRCTFFFLTMQRMGLAGEIWGRGQAGSPFGVTLASPPA